MAGLPSRANRWFADSPLEGTGFELLVRGRVKLVVVPFDAPGCLGRVGSRPGDLPGLIDRDVVEEAALAVRRAVEPDALHQAGGVNIVDQDLPGAGWRLGLAGGDGFLFSSRRNLASHDLAATGVIRDQITLAGSILVTTVVGVAIFLVTVLLRPETKGKVLPAELTVA
jgi:hypothetical protein